MKKKMCAILLISTFPCFTFAETGQPKVPLTFPANLLNWSAAADPDIIYNVSTVPLKDRFHIAGLKANSNAKANQGRIQDCSSMGLDATILFCQGDHIQNRYVFHHWQLIDETINFGGAAGSGIVLAPSADQTDAAHRNGVRCLGNFFFPPQAYGGSWKWVEEFLYKLPDGSFPIADKVIEMAEYCGFDGWFINQETAYNSSQSGTSSFAPALTASQAAVRMREWMQYFQSHSSLRLCWYDAMTESGSVSWQNQLNASNDWYFQYGGDLVSETMFLNFWWSDQYIINSAALAQTLGRDPYDVYAGVDVQANGYNTSVNWNSVFPAGSPHRTSMAFYMANWCFVGTTNPIATFYTRSDNFWSGANRDPSNTATPISGTTWNGLAHYIAEMSVINDMPFVTNFNTGHGTKYFIDGVQLFNNKQWSNRSVQDIPPTWQWIVQSSGTKLYPDYDWNSAYYGPTSLKISGVLDANNTIKLFMTDLLVASNTQLQVVGKLPSAGSTNMKVVLTFADDLSSPVYFDFGTGTGGWDTKTFSLTGYAGRHIALIGLFFDGTTPVPSYAINIGRIAVVNTGSPAPVAPTNLQLIQKYPGRIVNTVTTMNARFKWDHSASDGIRFYNVYKRNADNSRVYLGTTPHNNYYVNAIPLTVGQNTVMEVEAVDETYTTSAPTSLTLPPYITPVSLLNIDLGNSQAASYIPTNQPAMTITTNSTEQQVDGTPSTKFGIAGTFDFANMNISQTNMSSAYALAINIYGDGSNALVRFELYSSAKSSFVYKDILLDFTGWKQFLFKLDGTEGGMAESPAGSRTATLTSVNIWQVSGPWNSVPSTFYIDNARILRRNPADLNDDKAIDYKDLFVLTAYWLTDNYDADMFKDGRVNFADFAMLCGYWN